MRIVYDNRSRWRPNAKTERLTSASNETDRYRYSTDLTEIGHITPPE